MWDMLSYLVPPASTVIVLASILYYMSRLVLRWQARSGWKRDVARRFNRHVKRRGYWMCIACKHKHFGTVPHGPVCMNCWHALDAYLQEVA